MATEKRKLGDLGEGLARKYLEKEGYKVVGQNYHTRGGEIDIIARDHRRQGPAVDGINGASGQFVFVEVKTRLTGDFGFPVEAVTAAKQKKMILTATKYLLEQKKDPENFRLDVISVELNDENHQVKIKHFKSITNN